MKCPECGGRVVNIPYGHVQDRTGWIKRLCEVCRYKIYYEKEIKPKVWWVVKVSDKTYRELERRKANKMAKTERFVSLGDIIEDLLEHQTATIMDCPRCKKDSWDYSTTMMGLVIKIHTYECKNCNFILVGSERVKVEV